MIVEMRTYKTKPGTRARFLEIFRTKSMPAHAEIGMKILGPFLSVEDEDTFFFMRGFPDLKSREPMKARFYEGELWKSELENLLMPMPSRSMTWYWWRTRDAFSGSGVAGNPHPSGWAAGHSPERRTECRT